MAKALPLKASVIEKQIAKKPIFLGLDFDGTLAPIVRDPKNARMPQPIKVILKKLSKRKDVTVVIVSGRSISQLKRLTGLRNYNFIGNHGFEMQFEGKESSPKSVNRFKKQLAPIKGALKKVIRHFDGSILEDKGAILAIHYRMVAPHRVRAFNQEIHRVLEPYLKNKIASIGSGKKVWEVRPKLPMDKGKAIRRILEKKRFANIFYFGDDLTDEDAFKALRRGVSVHVGSRRDTQAKFRVSSPRDVHRFVKLFAAVLERESA